MRTGDRLRVAELFTQALELPDQEREAFVQATSERDSNLGHRLRQLLEADGKAGVFLDLEKTLDDRRPDPLPGPLPDYVGPYRLLHEIGAGGMGEVYLAVRDDDAFKRQVAIKFIGRGKASQEARRRLQIERQILASFNHPNIASIYDGGTTEDGLSYVVLEYIEGLPIDLHCDRQELTLAERIELFLVVCDAVELAHRSLVIHRDLKPSNILVDTDGVVKLLDFGIAKLLRPDLLGIEGEETERWMRLLTPAYASPEQIRGEAVTTTSDVYSLGVLLFELLTGKRPFDPEERVESADSEQEPARASDVAHKAADEPGYSEVCQSRGLDPARLSRTLTGDLDSILSKAMRSSARHRYPTVSHLGEDLRRYLQHRPVSARRGSLSYLGGKLLRRHWVAVGTSTIVIAALLSTLFAVDRARDQRSRAELERRTRTGAIDLMAHVFRSANIYLNTDDSELTLRQVLENAEHTFVDEELDIDAVAGLHEVLGSAYQSIGENDLALEQFRHILDQQTRLHGEDSLESALARSSYGSAFNQVDIDQAILQGERAVETIRRLEGDGSREIVVPLNLLLDSYCVQGDYEKAARWTPQALALTRRFFGEQSVEVGRALNNSAQVLKNQERFDEAKDHFREAKEIMRRRFSDRNPHVLVLALNEASVARKAGDLEESLAIYQKNLLLQEKAYKGDHPDIGVTLHNLAVVLADLKRFEEAAEKERRAVEITRAALGVAHPRTVIFETKLAKYLARSGRAREGIELLELRLIGWRFLFVNPKLIAAAEKALGEIS